MAGRERACRHHAGRERAGAGGWRTALHDLAAPAGRPLSGLAAHPASSLSARAVAYLAGGTGGMPAGSLAIVRDVLGLAHANRHVAERIAAALLGPDPRFARTTDGRWTLADSALVAPSPAIETCRFAVVDVETTGTRARRGDRIIEIAVVIDGQVAFHTLVNPGFPIPPFVGSLTGISDDMLRDAPRFDAVVDDLLHALQGCVFVAHNARFDWTFVAAEVARARGLLLAGPRVCTVRLARRLLPDLPRRNLDTVADFFGITIEGRHRAVGDAVAAARVLGKLVGMARDLGAETLADLEQLRIADCGLRNEKGRSLAALTPPLTIRNPKSAIRNPDP